jgi:two-component system nitrate/nitrite response regulator NarL
VRRRIVHTTPLNEKRKPRVLLVDDHRRILDLVSAALREDFHVVGLATGGSEALEKAAALEPDVIVMDVEMPGLDGFQTIQALQLRELSPTPVVFLSMHAAPDVISEAFRHGGRGYVLNTELDAIS